MTNAGNIKGDCLSLFDVYNGFFTSSLVINGYGPHFYAAFF